MERVDLAEKAVSDRLVARNLRDSPPAWADREALHVALDAVEQRFGDPAVVRVHRVKEALFAYAIGFRGLPEPCDQTPAAVAICAYAGVLRRGDRVRRLAVAAVSMVLGAGVVWTLLTVLYP